MRIRQQSTRSFEQQRTATYVSIGRGQRFWGLEGCRRRAYGSNGWRIFLGEGHERGGEGWSSSQQARVGWEEKKGRGSNARRKKKAGPETGCSAQKHFKHFSNKETRCPMTWPLLPRHKQKQTTSTLTPLSFIRAIRHGLSRQ